MKKLHFTSSNGVVRIFRTPTSIEPIAILRTSDTAEYIERKLKEAINQLVAQSPVPLDIFNKNGLVRKVAIYGGYWVLNFTPVPVRLPAKRLTLEGDVQYIALRVCMQYGIQEDSVTFHVIKHALRSLFVTKVAKV